MAVGEDMELANNRLRWDRIDTSTQIPALRVRPSRMQLFMFSAITWNRHRIHYDRDAAMGEGLPDIVVQRALIGNFLARLITDWVGDSAELRTLEWKVARSALPDKEIVCRARIKERVESEAEKYLVCEVTVTDEDEQVVASGQARVIFSADHATK
ncbi:MAG TPA: hypothetical protein PLU87_15285 [Sedimentisphaerales bacterium]|nr:hypothetical protein [Sedimentisphaerales bacterium]HRS12414.1 hypothetical protein [Sedimentisphaerales bacterium]HRV48944.1 hypothetical protein [Sedimentisphaerales bacterium]